MSLEENKALVTGVTNIGAQAPSLNTLFKRLWGKKTDCFLRTEVNIKHVNN